MQTTIGVHEQETILRRPELAQLLCEELKARDIRRVIFLGIPVTMEEPFLRTTIARWGIMVLTPPAHERAWLAQVQDELACGTITADMASHFSSLVADGAEHGVNCVVIASQALMALARHCELEAKGITLVDALRAGSSRVRNVVFDMGRVLLEWHPLAMARATCETDDDAELLANAVFGSAEWVLHDADAVDSQTVAWMAKTRVPERLHDSVDQLVHHWYEDRTFMPQTGELIGELKATGYGIYLLSNAGVEFDNYKHRLPAYECFDGMVVSCYEHVLKPDARIYTRLCERFDLAPNTCLFVDDVEHNVEGARRIGMQGWHFDGTVEALHHFLLGNG
ncbi:MAG: HAD-IA family hydrolase [Coriobacteriales bacterium]|nr:HAD-IA family hydrolase [Coriobacteriales bacterium]